MTSKFRPILFAAAASAALLCPSTAHALEFVTFGVGFIGQAGGNFLDKPDDQTIQGRVVTPEYPGFAGLMTGVGGFIDIRFIDYVGIELDVYSASHKGSADFTVYNKTTDTESSHDVEISNSALHIPLLIKGAIPGEIVTPVLFVGPEFVLPGDSEIAVTPAMGGSGANFGVVADLESYTVVTFGLGMEFNLPIPGDVVGVRIPLTLRGSVDPGSPNTREERSSIYDVQTGADGRVTAYTEDYKNRWKFQALATLGASVHF
ncbi:MAG: outer membrane beta-barrel protein [Polyangiaceae bacterium]